MSWPSDGQPRFVVHEIEGYVTGNVGGDSKGPGLSCVVLDRPWNHRLIREFRSERAGGGITREYRRERVRRDAATLAARLNTEHAKECAA